MIGLSLSMCVLDLLTGKVALNDVRYIITSCKPVNGLDDIIESYMGSYWCEHKEADVRKILSQLELRHPRLDDNLRYPILGNGRWVKSESEITWNN